jgi:hypothetical protein
VRARMPQLQMRQLTVNSLISRRVSKAISEAELFRKNIVLPKGAKLSNDLDYISDEVKLEIGDIVEVNLETLKLTDLKRLTVHSYGKWLDYLQSKRLGLTLQKCDLSYADVFEVTENKQP